MPDKDPFIRPDPFGIPLASHGSQEMTESMHLEPERDKHGTRVYVKLHMEGITGVVSPEQLDPARPEYEHARSMLMSDLRAVLEGVFAVGCTEAVVYDAHAEGRNIDLLHVDERATIVCGRPQPTNDFVYGLDESFDALFLIGCHARTGAAGAMFPRTYYDDVAAMRVNGTELGEIGMEAAIGGEFGVPLALVSGDSGGIREARELLGADLETVEVKQPIAPGSAICLPASRSAQLLHEAAARALRRARNVPLVVFPSPTTLEVEFTDPQRAAALERVMTIERVDDTTIRTRGPNILAAFRQFLDARNGRSAQRTELKEYTRPQVPPGKTADRTE